jgi:hypothetical protein
MASKLRTAALRSTCTAKNKGGPEHNGGTGTEEGEVAGHGMRAICAGVSWALWIGAVALAETPMAEAVQGNKAMCRMMSRSVLQGWPW